MKVQYNSTRVKAPANLTASANALYDGATPKPSGRVEPDSRCDTDVHSFIRRKNRFQVSTFNTRTLNPISRKHELVKSASKHHNDIICIQEHRQFHPESLRIEHIDAYQLITASATKNSCNASVGGVGFLISPRAQKSLLSVEKVSSRIMVLHLNGNPRLTVICIYSPTNSCETADREEFYKTLSRTIASVPKHNMVAVCGDFNAKISNSNSATRFAFHQQTNENGECLLDLIEEHKLIITNTRFEKVGNKKWTYEDPKRSKHQLDYILWRKKWANSVKNCQAYNTMATVGSDHRIVTCYAKVSYRVSKAPPSDPLRKVEWSSLSTNPELGYEYAVEVRNRYDVLLQESDSEAGYSLLVDSAQTTALKMLPKKKPRKRLNPYNDPDIAHHRNVLKEASLAHRTAPSFATKDHLENCKKQLDSVYTTVTEKVVKEKTDLLEKTNSEHRHHSSWKIIRDITTSNTVPFCKVPGDTSEERLKVWQNHFETLLGSHPPVPDLTDEFFNNKVSETLPISCEAFTLSELQVVIKSLQAAKSPGLDYIPPSFWKLPNFQPDLLQFCNEALIQGKIPEEWTTASIVPLPKKGNLTKPENYRGISLTSVAAKVFNKLILNRLYPFIDPLLRPNQNGFRRGRSTLPQILAIRRILQECRIGNKSAALIFVDFSKAFDSINREALFHILSLYGIPAPLIKAIKLLYDRSTSRVRTSDGLTDLFRTLMGVLQGDTLAPFLFIIVLDYVLRNSMSSDQGLTIIPRKSRRVPAVKVTDLDFADDLALIADTINQAEKLLHDLEHAASSVGLSINSSKTEFMALNIEENDPAIKSINGNSIEQVEDFKYLGSYIANDRKDFNTRKGLAWTACTRLQKIWTSKISEELKTKFFRACVEPVLLYGSETWTLNKEFQKRLDGCYTRLLMKVKNLNWQDHPNLQRIYGDLPRISTTVAIRRARFAGHCMRASDQIISTILPWREQQKNRGRRPLTFLDTVARDTEVQVDDLRTAMSDRAVWRTLVNGVSSATR